MAAVLWDIDGTLIRSGSLGTQIFDEAFTEVVGQSAPPQSFHGKTDPQIIAEHLTAIDRAHDEALIDAVVESLVSKMALHAPTMATEGWLLPGVVPLLETFARAGVHQSVLTGNVRANAIVKLETFGLLDFLDLSTGAFGSDHAHRPALGAIALERLHASGRELDPSEVWIIGDSPNDWWCAETNGFRCILVATGVVGYHELAGLGADACVTDLSDAAALASLVTSSA